MRRTSALIAGGGPSGAAAAILLARGGAAPVLIERNRQPHDVVCGAFMGGDAIASLAALGLDIATLGAKPIRRARLIAGTRIAEFDLPFPAAGLSRRTLDTAMLARAEAAGAGVERGIAIRRVDPDTRELHLGDGTTIDAEALFLATGKHDLRGALRPVPERADPAIGLRVRLSPSPALTEALDRTIELHLFRGGYAGLLLQEDGSANLCLSVAQSRIRGGGPQPETLIAALAHEAPLLADRFGAASAVGPCSSVARIPYGWRAGHTQPGLFRLGDQSSVIASLAGDGIAIALASATAAAAAFLKGGPQAALGFQPAFAKTAHRPIALAEMLRHTGEVPWIAGPLVHLFARMPGLMRHAASMTRIGS